MNSNSAFVNSDAQHRRTVDDQARSGKSVFCLPNGEKYDDSTMVPVTGWGWTSSLVALGLALAVSGLVALENMLDLGLVNATERILRLLAPGFCFAFASSRLTVHLGDRVKFGDRRSVVLIASSCVASEAIVSVLFGESMLSWLSSFSVFSAIAFASRFSSLGFWEVGVVVLTVGFLRFLSCVTFATVPLIWRPLLGYGFIGLGLLAAKSKVCHLKLMTFFQSHDGDVRNSCAKVVTSPDSSLSTANCVAVNSGRRKSLPVMEKLTGEQYRSSKQLRKVECMLTEMLSYSDISQEILSRLQALLEILKAPDSPVVHRRSKSIPLVTLSGGSNFSQQVADLPYTLTEESSYATKRFRRHYSVVGHRRRSGAWSLSGFTPNVEWDSAPSNVEPADPEKSDGKKLRSDSLADPTVFDSRENLTDEKEERHVNGSMSAVESDRLFSKETGVPRKTSFAVRRSSSHPSSSRSSHVSFADDPTILNYEVDSPENETETVESETETETVNGLEIPKSDILTRLLDIDLLNAWHYPIFDLAEEAPDETLSLVATKIFTELGLIQAFEIPMKEFRDYFQELERGYRDNPYHNRFHATDVLHAVNYMMTQPIYGFTQVIPTDDYSCQYEGTRASALVSRIQANGSSGILGANFLAIELMASLTAAAMHDYDHPGRTNAFLISTCHPLAVLYNNRSVLENHHAASAWSLLISDPRFAWLVNLSDAEFKRFRFLVIDQILATDLVLHFKILENFNAKVNEDLGPGINWTCEDDRLMISKTVIKMADISGPCKDWEQHTRWTERIAEEFYAQGDEECMLQMSVSPYMDRSHPQLAKLQESFITHLVAPLCNALCGAGLLPCRASENSDVKDGSEHDDTQVNGVSVVCLMTKNLQENHTKWVNIMNTDSADGSTAASS